ncbi:hypothetical protein M0638_12610 [Roseomonas sp. NAR14]|uniref:Uncharacterized protein n=1 Tax=Roseomonas acroporae TaxID=2937791 RepID=A0A9X1Y8T7_9PROT|nr:hypothetical protein [Roseomonas acroporae]MCK8785227.1 hypothetical protein [Roseomonas acroporae]
MSESGRVERVVMWTDGCFKMANRPTWWDEATAQSYGEQHTVMSFGKNDDYVNVARSWLIPESFAEEGWIIKLDSGDTVLEVWTPNDADYLDFITSRLPVWMKIGARAPAEVSLDRLVRAFIAHARRGPGQHIDRDSGESELDRADDMKWEREMREQGKLG